MKIIDGKLIAKNLRQSIAKRVKDLSRPPGLAVILVGNDPASQVYVRNKDNACREVGFYSEKIEKFDKRHEFKPGITGLAQISGFRGKLDNYHDMSSRVKLDRYYFKNWSLYLDFKIFFQTAFKLIRFNLS